MSFVDKITFSLLWTFQSRVLMWQSVTNLFQHGVRFLVTVSGNFFIVTWSVTDVTVQFSIVSGLQHLFNCVLLWHEASQMSHFNLEADQFLRGNPTVCSNFRLAHVKASFPVSVLRLDAVAGDCHSRVQSNPHQRRLQTLPRVHGLCHEVRRCSRRLEPIFRLYSSDCFSGARFRALKETKFFWNSIAKPFYSLNQN